MLLKATQRQLPVLFGIVTVLAAAWGSTHAQPGPSGSVAGQPPPAGRDPNRLWCSEHGVYEDECFLCHPELAQEPKDDHHEHADDRPDATKAPSTQPRDPNRLWCAEHGVYEDECFLCHPELATASPRDDGRSPGKDSGDGLWCREHNVAERECGICQPQLATRLTPGSALKVRLPSPQSAEKAGIRVVTPRESDTSASVKVFCEAHYDQNRLARITPLVAGVIHSVQVDVGQTVAEGELLVEIASPEVAAAKRDYLVALVTERLKQLDYDREKQLAMKEISAAQSFQQAEAELETARIAVLSARHKLINYGFTEEEADEVTATRSSSSIVHIHAPFSGTLVERSAVVGEAVELGTVLFTLADLSRMWLTLAVPESKAGLLQPGLEVRAHFASAPGFVAEGQVTWIDASVSEPTRVVAVRAVVDNRERVLRNNMFGEAQVFVGTQSRSLSLSSAAVQRFEQAPFVFVKIEDDLFELRRVVLGQAEDNRVQILEGIRPDEPVVVTGSFTMMSEFLKSRLGAGCVDD